MGIGHWASGIGHRVIGSRFGFIPNSQFLILNAHCPLPHAPFPNLALLQKFYIG
ncbi:MAG: hypothetical protein KME31_04780 [Tolypothrix carrinoi HA7290-LM1]|nr:hypothetical protein [Tolypothrix carrinoi HA7290-LM1]